MFALAETMYLCRTLGELLRMHSGCFCYRSNNVWFWKEQGLVSFAEMTCQKCKKKWCSQHPPPFFFNAFNHLSICVWWSKLMKQRTPTACHSQDFRMGGVFWGGCTQFWKVMIFLFISAPKILGNYECVEILKPSPSLRFIKLGMSIYAYIHHCIPLFGILFTMTPSRGWWTGW